MNRFLYIITNPVVVSLFLSTVILLLLPPVFDKYNLKLLLKTKMQQESDFFYCDLDNNGYSEQVIIATNSKGFAQLYVRDQNGSTIDQWNFNYPRSPFAYHLYSSDINNDGNKEVFVFTYNNDSIFLNAIDPIGTKDYLFQNRFICKTNKYKGKTDFHIKKGVFADLNNDGFQEIIFPITAGFALFPRRLFAYDFVNDSVLVSEECGNIISAPKTADINNDGVPEILVDTWSPHNYVDSSLSVVYHDTTTYLVVFNNQLKFYFPPIEYDNSIGVISAQEIHLDNYSYILLLHKITGNSRTKSSLQLVDSNGIIINKALLPEIDHYIFDKPGIPHITKDQIIIPTSSGSIFYYNFILDHISTRQLDINDLVFPNFIYMDLNNDGKDEVITYDSENNIIVMDNNLNYPITFSFNSDIFPKLTLKRNGPDPPELFAVSGKQIWILDYSFNKMYYWHYPICIAVFFIFLSLNLMIRKVQKNQIQKRFELRQQLTDLQLKTIKNQIEPHFTFNALNSIASVVHEENKDVAYDYLVKISGLVRTTLLDADRITRTLEEELKFVSNYLELQKFRFQEKFDFSINVAKDVNTSTLIPKMIIQIYAENSVKHGIIHKEDKGQLNITITNDQNLLILVIKDNGIGRDKAKEIGSRSTGKGQIIMQQYYSLYNKTSKAKIKHSIIDLKDEAGNAIGTKVTIKVPYS